MPRDPAHEPSAMLSGLADAGYHPCPMLPGGEGAAGWISAGGSPVEFHEAFAEHALREMPADATAESGIVAGHGLVIVRTLDCDNSTASALPWTPVTWGTGENGFALYRSSGEDYGDLLHFGDMRSCLFEAPHGRIAIVQRAAALPLPADLDLPPLGS